MIYFVLGSGKLISLGSIWLTFAVCEFLGSLASQFVSKQRLFLLFLWIKIGGMMIARRQRLKDEFKKLDFLADNQMSFGCCLISDLLGHILEKKKKKQTNLLKNGVQSFSFFSLCYLRLQLLVGFESNGVFQNTSRS